MSPAISEGLRASFANEKLRKVKDLLRPAYYWLLSARLARPLLRLLARRKLRQFSCPYKLHLGCGLVRLEGWVNVDLSILNPAVDLPWDLMTGLPFEDGSCQVIYCEHLLEHLAVEDGVRFLQECRRVLAAGGVLRVAMPSLDVILGKATGPDWRDQDWLTWPEYQSIQTRAEMVNICFYWWGHKWLYDRQELHRRLRQAGFTTIRDVAWGQSTTPELQNRETRKDSLLICEARK